jgi:hypothetical protein
MKKTIIILSLFYWIFTGIPVTLISQELAKPRMVLPENLLATLKV